MIDQIAKNDQEIEMYYHMGSVHGDVRMILNKYFYDESNLRSIIDIYSNKYTKVNNININLTKQTISFDLETETSNFQYNFADAMYSVVSLNYEKILNLIDLFEKENKKYNTIKEIVKFLLDPNYYITLFRTAFIKHESCTSCILQF